MDYFKFFFFTETQFPNQTVNFCLQRIIHIWKANAVGIHLSYPGTLLVHPVMRPIFVFAVGLKCELYFALCHKYSTWKKNLC